MDPVKQVLADANMEKSKVDQVVLVGGSTRIPKVGVFLFGHNQFKLTLLLGSRDAIRLFRWKRIEQRDQSR